MISLLVTLLVGGLIGMIAGAILKKGSSMGILANIFAGLAGSFVGVSLFGRFGPSLAGISIIPAVIGAIIVVAVVSFFLRER
jgi:Transglycosylase associated protein.